MAEQFLNQTGGKAATEFQESLATLQSYNLPCSETKEKIKTLKNLVSSLFGLEELLGIPERDVIMQAKS